MAMLKSGAFELIDLATLVGHWPGGGLGVAMVIAMGFFKLFVDPYLLQSLLWNNHDAKDD